MGGAAADRRGLGRETLSPYPLCVMTLDLETGRPYTLYPPPMRIIIPCCNKPCKTLVINLVKKPCITMLGLANLVMTDPCLGVWRSGGLVKGIQ